MDPVSGGYAPWEADEPTVSELAGIRYLHFGTEWVQGAMRLRRPNDLVLAYTQQMMAWLLFVEPDADTQLGILGLGAGSLLRFSLRNTPASITTVEWNPMVTAVCRSHFRLPDSPRSVIEHCDAADWVRDPANTARHSALMVDLYDALAQGPVRGSPEFYGDCARVMAPLSAMTVNLFGEHASFEPNIEALRSAFPDGLVVLPEIDAGNRVAIGVKGPLLDVSVGDFLDRAQALEVRFKLPAMRWARDILQQLQQAR